MEKPKYIEQRCHEGTFMLADGEGVEPPRVVSS